MSKTAERTARAWLRAKAPGLGEPRWLAALASSLGGWGAEGRLPFVAGLIKALAMGCSLKGGHDKLVAWTSRTPTKSDIATLEAWGWEYDDEEESFASFFPGG